MNYRRVAMGDNHPSNIQHEGAQDHQHDSSTRKQPSLGGSTGSQAGRQYWEKAGADIDGMLGGVPGVGGFSSVSRIDLQGSRTFLARLGIGVKNGRRAVASALEGGAGYVHSR